MHLSFDAHVKRPAKSLWSFWQWAGNIQSAVQLLSSLGATAVLIFYWRQVQEFLYPLPLAVKIFFWGGVGLGLIPLVVTTINVYLIARSKRRFIEFYDDRRMLNRVRGGIETEIERSSEVWVAWATAAVASVSGVLRSKKITRVLLFSPRHPHLKQYGEMISLQESKQMADIETATKIILHRRENDPKSVTLGWITGPVTFVTIGDPNKKTAWARVDGYFTGDGRPSYVVYKREHPGLFEEIKKYYEALWATAQPPALDTSPVTSGHLSVLPMGAIIDHLRDEHYIDLSLWIFNSSGEVVTIDNTPRGFIVYQSADVPMPPSMRDVGGIGREAIITLRQYLPLKLAQEMNELLIAGGQVHLILSGLHLEGRLPNGSTVNIPLPDGINIHTGIRVSRIVTLAAEAGAYKVIGADATTTTSPAGRGA